MGKAWGHSGPRVTWAPRGPSGFQEGALSPPPPPLSAPALRDKSLVALGTGASRGHCPVSPVTQASGDTREWVLAAAVAPECSGIGFGQGYNSFSQRKPWQRSINERSRESWSVQAERVP